MSAHLVAGSNLFGALGKGAQQYQKHGRNGFILIVTIGFEELAKFLFFACPCEYPQNQKYGWAFIFGPAFLLFLVALVSQDRMWQLLTGLCLRKRIISRKRMLSGVSLPAHPWANNAYCWCSLRKFKAFIKVMYRVIAKSLAVPAVWVLICLLRGDYYVCAKYPNPIKIVNGTEIIGPKPCEINPKMQTVDMTSENDQIVRNLYGESHLLAWWLFLPLGALGVLIKCLGACFSPFTFEQDRMIDEYEKVEHEIMTKKINEFVTKRASDNIDFFFEEPRRKEEWDRIALIKWTNKIGPDNAPVLSPLDRFHKSIVRAKLQIKKEEKPPQLHRPSEDSAFVNGAYEPSSTEDESK